MYNYQYFKQQYKKTGFIFNNKEVLSDFSDWIFRNFDLPRERDVRFCI